MELKTSRLLIRFLKDSDYPIWYKAHKNMPAPRNVWDQNPRPEKELTLSQFKKYLKLQANLRKKDLFYDFAIFLKKDKILIGHVGIMEVTRGLSHSAYLGYRIFNPYWGQGYAKEAVDAVILCAFKQLKLHRLEAGIEPQNKKSIALAKSLDLRYEGTQKRKIFLRDQWVDFKAYCVTCEDRGIPFQGQIPERGPRA